MQEIVPARQIQAARRLRQTLSVYNQSREILSFGAWKPGANPALDHAVALWPAIERFLQQDLRDQALYADSVRSLESALASRGPEIPSEAVA